MTTINYRGVDFVLCKPHTIELLQEEIHREEWERSAQEALERAYSEGDWDLFSDLYKDLYGVRPRW